MALTSNSLTNGGLTTNFQVQYEDSLSNQATVISNANALLTVLEGEFGVTTGWFNTPAGNFGTGNRQVVNLNLTDTATTFPGANNSGHGSAINLDAQNIPGNAALAPGRVEMVFMAEWSEILMSLSGGKWNAGDSTGEGLSQFCSILRFQAGHYNYYSSWVDQWLNGTATSPNAARSDWVNHTFTGSGSLHGDGDTVSFGCALAFLFYLQNQLSFTPAQIIQAGSAPLATAYHTLTSDPGDPFPFFLNLIASVFPASGTASIPGPVTDNPFPIAMVSFWDQKNTFGKDESQDIIDTLGGLVNAAFYVVVEGFSKHSFNTLGVQVSAFSGTFFNLPGVNISPNPLDAQFENGVNDFTPQRIRIPFDITLSDPIISHFPMTGTVPYGLSVSLNIAGTQVSGSSASTEFELIAGADPYFSNIDPNIGNESYLSQDLRVFTATPALNDHPFPSGPQFPASSDSPAGAFTYIQALLTYLNSTFTNPNGTDPFASLLPNQVGEGQTESSVTPITLDLSHGILNPRFDNNYNFAIARVRIRGQSGVPGEALGVKVFFRLWTTLTNETDYDVNTTYRSTSDPAGNPGSPLLGTGNNTIPFFATGDLATHNDYGASGPNIHTMIIPNHQDQLWWYFGCFINLYDPNNKIGTAQIQTYLNGDHHCLVAQIAFDDAPIPQGVSALSWDQLAQRNIQITRSDNPGPASAHRIPQTFDCRPSKAVSLPKTGHTVFPDELMIDWGAIPVGSVASLYWPHVLAADVVALANEFYGANPLAVADNHTIKVEVTGGITYIPIPTSAGENFAGLFTVDLPTTVTAGEEFNITVRRVATRSTVPPPPPPPPPPVPQSPRTTHAMASTIDLGSKKAAAKATQVAGSAKQGRTISWRYVVGTFQVKIPVTTSNKILPQEEVTLAIMKWRLEQMSPLNRWYPVLLRYIEYLSERVDGLGGNASAVKPSLTGIPPGILRHENELEFTGKVSEVVFDCFGDFEGFVLSGCCGHHVFESRYGNICELVLRACREQLLISVFVDHRCHNKISRLVVRQ